MPRFASWLLWATFLLHLTCTATSAAGQDDPALASSQAPDQLRALTFSAAIAYARANQPLLLAARSRQRAGRASAEVPRGLWMPRVTAAAEAIAATENNSTAAYVSVAGIDLARVGSTRVADTARLNPYASTLVGVGVRQELFDFGRIAAQTAAADAMAEVQDSQADAELLQLELTIEEAFLAVRAAKLVCKAAEDAYSRAEVSRDTARAGVQSGLRKPIELTRAEADVSRFDVGRIRAQGGLVAAQTLLAAAVGVPDERLDVSGDVPKRPEVDPAAIVKLALARDPGVRAARAAQRAQQAQTQALEAERRPDLMLTSSINLRAGGAPPSSGPTQSGAGLAPNLPNWDVGVVFLWGLLDAPVTARAEASRWMEKTRAAETQATQRALTAAVQQAWSATTIAAQVLPALSRSLAAAQSNYQQAEVRFKAGLGNLLELADAQMLRTDAEIQLALGDFEYARARAKLGRLLAERL